MSKRPVGTGRVGRQKAKTGKARSPAPISRLVNLAQAQRHPVPCSESLAPRAPAAPGAASWWTLLWRIQRLKKKTGLKHRENSALFMQSLNLVDSSKLRIHWWRENLRANLLILVPISRRPSGEPIEEEAEADSVTHSESNPDRSKWNYGDLEQDNVWGN